MADSGEGIAPTRVTMAITVTMAIMVIVAITDIVVTMAATTEVMDWDILLLVSVA
jgi:hypothetical protein